MASKIQKVDESDEDECIVEDMGSDLDKDEDEEDKMDINEEIKVDFEGFQISDNDFHGIRQLLKQLFPKENLDTSALSNLLISQNFLGTVLKQSDIPEDSSDDSENDDVFGITSCLSVNGMPKPVPAVEQVITMLADKISQHATDEKIKSHFTKLLSSSKDNLCFGWIINERFINLPPQVALPMFEKLSSELGEASKRDHKTCYDFGSFLMICKTYRAKNKKNGESCDQQFKNAEEELFMEYATASVTYPLKEAAGLISGSWDEDADEFESCRTVLTFTKDSFAKIISKLQKHLSFPVT